MPLYGLHLAAVATPVEELQPCRNPGVPLYGRARPWVRLWRRCETSSRGGEPRSAAVWHGGRVTTDANRTAASRQRCPQGQTTVVGGFRLEPSNRTDTVFPLYRIKRVSIGREAVGFHPSVPLYAETHTPRCRCIAVVAAVDSKRGSDTDPEIGSNKRRSGEKSGQTNERSGRTNDKTRCGTDYGIRTDQQ